MTESLSESFLPGAKNEGLVGEKIGPKKSFGNTKKLFQDAEAGGVVSRLTLGLSSRRVQVFEEKLEITKEYLLTDVTLEEVGKKYNLFRQGVWQKVRDVISSLYQAGDEEFKKNHPLEEISYRKPYSLTTGEKASETQGGSLAKVMSAMREFGTAEVTPQNIEAVAQIAGLTRQDIFLLRPQLGKRGIRVFEAKPQIYRDFARRIEKEDDYRKLQNILDEFFPQDKPYSLHSYLDYRRKDERKVLTDFSSVLRDAGFFVRGSDIKTFADKIKEKHLPIIIRSVEMETPQGKNVIQTYYAVPAKCQGIIKETLRNDPDLATSELKENPVRLICGATERMPTSADLTKKSEGKYAEKLAVLARETMGFVVNTAKPDWNLTVLMKDCPVPVFRYRKQYYFPKDRLEEIKAYLESKKITAPNQAG